MTVEPRGRKVAGVSDAAVREKTGKDWQEWIATLDRAGAVEMEHSARARHLAERHGVTDWWAQMIAVGYDQARGTRLRYQKKDGFAASASRTVEVPVEVLFDAWHDDARRRRWLGPEPLMITKATRPKSMRIQWPDGSRVAVYFLSKGAMRSQVSVQHEKLATADDAGRVKQLWGDGLDRLKRELGV